MPQLGLEVTEGTVVELLVSVGSAVEIGTPLIVLATDKADTEVVAPAAGIVRAVHAGVGDTVVVGETLIELADSIEETATAAPELAAPTPSAAATKSAPSTLRPAGTGRKPSAPGRRRAAPVARRAAEDLGIALEELTGSGPNGRVTLNDVRQAAAARSTKRDGISAREETLSALRRAVARRMSASQREIPQFHLERDLDARHVLATIEAQRAAASSSAPGARVGINDLLIQATATMLTRHPLLLARFVEAEGDTGPQLVHQSEVDVGLAVATDAGLLVPVLRQADQRSLRELATDRTRLVGAARAGKLDLTDMSGGAISISNLGLHGVDRFAAMVNPGQSSILAVGRLVERVVPRQRGTEVVPTINLTITCDHRVIDGAAGAQALADLASLLEGDMTWRP